MHAKTSNYGEEVIFVDAVEFELPAKQEIIPEWMLMEKRVFLLEKGRSEFIAGENSNLTKFLLEILQTANRTECNLLEEEWIANEEEAVEWIANRNKILKLDFKVPEDINGLKNVTSALFVLKDELGYGLDGKILVVQDSGCSCWMSNKNWIEVVSSEFNVE